MLNSLKKKIFCGLILFLACQLRAQLPAFPGAEGFGKFTTGARGGTVYHVTTLADSGAGSFRDACSVSGRTIVFDIGGVIDYSGSRFAPKPNITIAGQTAPGDGITIYGNGLSFSGANNNLVRFIRVREGINGDSGTDAMGIANGNTMIFDHITSSWGRDETFSINGVVNNITIQSAIISQGLQGHSAGGLIQTDGGVSILRSLYIDNDTRNPKVKGVNEYVNNVVCNWETIGYNMGGDSAGESFVNVFNNYFMRGQAGSSSAIYGGNTDFHIYATNNWSDMNKNGVLDGGEMSFASYGPMDLKTTPFAYPITNAYSPLTALKLAISDSGPSFKRDSVDELMMTQLTSWGLLGGTITSELVAPMNGPGVVRNGTPYTDTDQDGMPDFWENGTGSNPAVANNNDPSPSGSGYTRLEDYLNWLAEPHGIALMNTNVVIDLRQFTRGWVVVNHSPSWSVSSPVNGTVTLINSYFAQFVPTPGLNSNASFAFTVNDADGSPVTRTMNLFFTPSAQSYKTYWHGDDLTNNWNTLADFNWHDGTSLLYQFHAGEAVTFDDSGSTNPAVNLIGSLQPASVTINATKSFALSGSGSLNGSMTLNKTNTGTLTINTTNTFTGATTVSNGTVLVHGALNRSAVTVKNSGTIGGHGRLGNGVTVQSGGNTAPGNGIGGAGTLTISNSLTLANNVTHRLDMSDDPTGTVKTNDQINVVGTLSVTGTNYIRVNLLDGPLLDGTYTLFKYTTLVGGLANFVLINANGVLTNPPGQIAIHVANVRLPGNLKWVGNGVNNNWDNGSTTNWLNGATPDVFYFFDSVRFDDTGSTNPAVNLVGSLTPQAVTFDATKNYTVSGGGAISGYGTLTKTNSGTLILTAVSDYAGATTLGGGVLSVAQLVNSGIPSPLGAADSRADNLLFEGGTLRYTGGSTSTDRGATFDATANLEVASAGTTLTWNGGFVGAGALQKSGAGVLTVTANNTFTGGTIVSNGTLALFGPSGGASITANNYALGSGPVTLYGGTLSLFGGGLSDAAAGYGTFSRPIDVPTNATVTLLTPARYTMSSKLTGGGTLNLEVNYVRGAMNGNWSEFAGTINITGRTADSEFRIGTSSGYAGATLNVGNNAVITRSGSAITIEIGALAGTSAGRVGPGNSSSSGSSYRVGWNNQDATFAGQLLADGANTFTKVGTGNWTLTGANSYTGGTIVDGGTLTVNNASGSGTGSGAVTVNTGATLAGNGIISGSVTINSGAAIAPGTSIGTLTVNNSVTLASGSATLIEINRTTLSQDLLNVLTTLNYGGTLTVTNLSGTLASGDSFKIFDAATYAGSFIATNLPPLAPGLSWQTAALATSGTISIVSTNDSPTQPIVWKGDGVANLWDVNTSVNWLTISNTARGFFTADPVVFNDSGSNSPAVNLTTALAPGSVNVNANQNYTFSGVGALAGAMPLTKSGSGTLTFANSGSNSFSGGTVIVGGAVTLAAANGLGAGPVTLAGSALNLGSLSLFSYNPLTVSGSNTITGGNGGGNTDIYAVSGSGTLSLAPNNVFDLSGDLSGFSGKMLFSGNQSVRINGATGSANAEFDLGTGSLNLNKRSNAGTITLGALTGGPLTTLQGASGGGVTTTLFTIGGNNGNSTFQGTIINGGGASSLTKVGTGTLTVTGTNTYSGATTVSAGTLLINGNNTASAVTVSSGATLGGTGTNGGLVTINSGGRISPGANGVGTFTANGGLTLPGSTLVFDLSSSPAGANDRINMTGTLGMSLAQNYIFNLTDGTLGAGTYSLIEGANNSTAWASAAHNLPTTSSRQTFSLTRPAAGSNPSYTRLVVTGTAASLIWRGTNGSTWDVATTNWLNAAAADKFQNADVVAFNDTAATNVATLVGNLQPGRVTLTNSAQNFTFTSTGYLSGPMQLIKAGTGSLTIDNTNSFTGGILVAGGTVSLTTNTAAGTGPITLAGGNISFASAGLPNYPNAINAIANSTVTCFTGNNTVSGAWTGAANLTLSVSIPSGIFTVAGSMTNFPGTIAISGNGTFRWNGNANTTSGSPTTSYDLGTGSASMINRNGATIALGALSGGAGTFLSGAGSADAASTYLVGANNASTTFNGTIKDSTALRTTAIVKIGTGAWTLTGNNTYTAGTTVSAGTLVVNNSAGSGTGTNAVLMQSGATLAGSGTIGGATTFQSGTTLSPGDGVGTLTFTNSLTLSSSTLLPFELGSSSDRVVVGGNLSAAGVINVIAVSGFGAGTYTLFTYPPNGLSLGNLVLGSAPAGYNYSLNTNTPGQIRLVVAANVIPAPVFGAILINNGSVVVNGSGGTPGGNYYVVTATNLTQPVAGWTRLVTNQFNAGGNFAFTNAIPPGVPQQFYRLQLP